jgi:large subunit ribosomal protein L17
MRHLKKVNHLGRTSAHRKALLSNLASSLILHKRIKTTVAKAKELKKFVEPIINRSKENTTHSRRVVFSSLKNKEAVNELFKTVSDKVANRPGGYTRILKLGNRVGDNAETCYIELVDFNENMLASADTKKAKTRRGRSRKKTDTTKSTTQETIVETTPQTDNTSAEQINNSENKDNEVKE